MNKCVLAIYDIGGIQKYIFQTSKLRDIVGASSLVYSALNDKLTDTAKSLDVYCDDFVLYSGGGNAILKFANVEQWKTFNSAFSRRLLLESPGLSFTTDYTDYDDATDDIAIKIQNLFTGVAHKKNLGRDGCVIDTLPPIAQSLPDRLPVSIVSTSEPDKGEFSFVTWSKRKEGNKVINNTNAESNEAIEIDDIAKTPKDYDKTERMVAIVHIDGNNMGKIFKRICEEDPNGIAKHSQEINELFKCAFDEIWKVIPPKSRRKIYQNGDDTTYICNCIYALKSVQSFIDYIYSKRTGLLSDLSVCAGIAYVKPHFPFSKAYEIAEQCCKKAKERASESMSGKIDVGSWVDFEIVRGSQGTDIMSKYRRRPYNVVNGLSRYSIKHLNEWIKKISHPDGARSKWKNLRNAYYMGDKEAVKLLMKSCKIPPPQNDEDDVVFDALDIIDIETGVEKKRGVAQ